MLHARASARPPGRQPVGLRAPLRGRRDQPEGGAGALRMEGLIGVSVDVSELESAAGDYERQVGARGAERPGIQAFVERLEQAAESDEEARPDVPSGDALAREFQRFLRQRGPER